MPLTLLNVRKRSLLRGTTLVLGSLALAFVLAGFPNDRASLKQLIPVIFAFLGTCDTAHCLRMRWSFYHGAVLVLLCADIMALFTILFLFLYPYGRWLQ